MKVFMSDVSTITARALFWCVSVAAFAVSGFAQAQSAAADLSGTVTDQAGAVVSGATVTARGTGTGISRTVSTDSDGNFQIISLPPGDYEVTAEASNFKKTVLSNVKLTVGQS